MMRYLIVLLLLPTLVGAVEYWPTEAGTTFRYVDDGGDVLDVEIQAGYSDGEMIRSSTLEGEWGICWADETYRVTDQDDVVLTYVTSMCSGWVDPDFMLVDPGLLMISDPQDPVSRVEEAGLYGSLVTVVIATAVPETITVPAGTFEVVPVYFMAIGYAPNLPTTWWLHRDLGPVKMEPGGWELESWTGIVSNDEMTWGDVKTLYR